MVFVVDADAHEVGTRAERDVPERLVRRMVGISSRVDVGMTAGNFEQRSVAGVRDVRG